MDFISNLIKRPISLVLNDSTEELRQQPLPSVSSHSTERVSTTPPRVNSLILNAMNCSGSANSHSVSASPSKSSNAATIEELLIQINDNLNQANVCDAIASDLNQNQPIDVVSTAEPIPTTSKATLCKANTTPQKSAATTEMDGNNAVASRINRTFNSVAINNIMNSQDIFDLTNLPDLPKELTNDIFTDVSFEDDLVPIMSVNMEPSHSAHKKDDVYKSQQNISTNETDTAFSSDNETFAECQSFPEHITGLSEADSYLSAVGAGNETLKNVCLEQTLNLSQPQKNMPENQQGKNETEYEDEPMDVDMSFTQELTSEDQHGTAVTLTAIVDRVEQLVTTAIVPNEGEVLLSASEQYEISSFSPNKVEENHPNIDRDAVPVAVEFETHQTLLSSCIDMSPSTANISVKDGAKEVAAPDTPNLKLNADTAASSGSVPNLASTFPIKGDRNDEQHFPRSPKTDVEKKMAYLEKSEYAERTEIKIMPSSPNSNKIDSSDTIHVLGSSPVQSEESTSPAPTSGYDMLNATFESVTTNSLSPDLGIIKTEKHGTYSAVAECCDENPDNVEVENRRTVLTEDAETKWAARRTFGIAEGNAIMDALELTGEIEKAAELTFGVAEGNEAMEASVVAAEFDAETEKAARRTFGVAEGNAGMDASGVTEEIDMETMKAARRTFGIAEGNAVMDAPELTAEIDAETKKAARRTFGVAEGNAGMDAPELTAEVDAETKRAARRTFGIAERNAIMDASGVTPEIDVKTKKDASELTAEIDAETEGNPVIEGMQLADDIEEANLSSKMQQNMSEVLKHSSQKPEEQHNAQLSINIESMDVDDSCATAPLSPPIPTLQKKPLEELALQGNMSSSQTSLEAQTAIEGEIKINSPHSPQLPTLERRKNAAIMDETKSLIIPTSQEQSSEETISQTTPVSQSLPISALQKHQHEDETVLLAPQSQSPPIPTLQKRPPLPTPPIYPTNEDSFVSPAPVEALSDKEKTKSNSRDEKDIYIDNFTVSPEEEIFSDALSHNEVFSGFGESGAAGGGNTFTEEDFQCGNNLILNPSDFAYLLTKGNSNEPVDRSSILLKFDPLLGVAELANQPREQQKVLQQILGSSNYPCLSPTLEEDEQIVHNKSTSAARAGAKPREDRAARLAEESEASKQADKSKKHASMSVDVINDINVDNDCNKSFENSNSQSDEKQTNYKMDELEKKIKNEVLKTEDIEKKLKDAEQREEALIKRITEKDKTVAKMNGVVEAYEKAIAELIAEKEQLIQNYEKQLAEVKADRDSNYHHLTSLETTFSDLHVKYEKSKEMTLQLKSNEESLLAEKRQNREYLRLQEQRYDKMKNHAMQQLEIANKKLETITKEHATETTKLKALLKKEEISRASMTEQLQQKTRENTELMQICDELINAPPS